MRAAPAAGEQPSARARPGAAERRVGRVACVTCVTCEAVHAWCVRVSGCSCCRRAESDSGYSYIKYMRCPPVRYTHSYTHRHDVCGPRSLRLASRDSLEHEGELPGGRLWCVTAVGGVATAVGAV